MTQENWALPGQKVLEGTVARVRPIDFDQDQKGFEASILRPDCRDLWRYTPIGPFESYVQFADTMHSAARDTGAIAMVIEDKEDGRVLGMASYLRNRTAHGSTEVGSIVFAPKLKQTKLATEAMYLMAAHVFDDLGYRRYEWKCNSLNAASIRAAERYGFTFEGTFRQDMMVKGENRDTAWFSMLDGEWPLIKAGFQTWLSSDNFDENGRQIKSLKDCRTMQA